MSASIRRELDCTASAVDCATDSSSCSFLSAVPAAMEAALHGVCSAVVPVAAAVAAVAVIPYLNHFALASRSSLPIANRSSSQ